MVLAVANNPSTDERSLRVIGSSEAPPPVEPWPPPGVVTEVPSAKELKKLKWSEQGDLELYSERVLQLRAENRDEDGVLAVLDAFWEAALIEDGDLDPLLQSDDAEQQAQGQGKQQQ